LLHTLKGEPLKQSINPPDIEVLTLKDFLKVFKYDNFAKRACEIIKSEFKANLTGMLNKQRNVEMTFKEQLLKQKQ